MNEKIQSQHLGYNIMVENHRGKISIIKSYKTKEEAEKDLCRIEYGHELMGVYGGITGRKVGSRLYFIKEIRYENNT